MCGIRRTVYNPGDLRDVVQELRESVTSSARENEWAELSKEAQYT